MMASNMQMWNKYAILGITQNYAKLRRHYAKLRKSVTQALRRYYAKYAQVTQINYADITQLDGYA